MKHLKQVASKYKALIAAFLMVGMAHGFLQSFTARYFQTVVDNFTDFNLTWANIGIYGIALFLLYTTGYLNEYPWRKLEHSIGLSLKTAALKKLSVIDYLSYVKLGTGTLIQRIESGSAAGRDILFEFYLRLAGELFPAMLFSIFFVFTINPTVMISILLGYVIVFIISNLLLKALYKVKERILVNQEKFNHFLVRGFMEMVVFRVNRRFAREISKAEAASKEIISSNVKMKMVHEAFFTIFAILIGIVKIGIIVYGWQTDALTIGQIVALVVLVDNAYQPIAIFNVLYVQFKLDKIAFNRYTEFLDTQDDMRLSQGRNVSSLKGHVTFSNIGFMYSEREIFKDLNLEIGPGWAVALVGESGSGKSTAAKLMAGLLRPNAGIIAVDGHDLKQVNLNSYYEHIAYLPQEPSIFNGTLKENLVFDEDADPASLLDAIKEAELGELYSLLENGLETQLGERGVTLSGGERQQLALARLWFTKANIIILDEATSAIDNLTEEAVMKNVMARLKGKTVIAIAHRLDSVKAFDNIIVFKDGQIAEQGRFDELLDNGRHFYELYHRAQI
ncbi:MAG: ABC transporter ATP-binding protein/permease [Defluviitaleaceae bacterium]|nr:ABC transporter ATP-binding protein/permease [Defluviitaleaceae bacterium]